MSASGSLTRTARAARRIAEIIAGEPSARALRVSVEGGGCSGFQYKFDLVAGSEPDDIVIERDAIPESLDQIELALSMCQRHTGVGSDGIAIVALHNFADRDVTATLPLTGLVGCALFDVLAADGSTVTVGDDATLEVTLPPYGYRWLRSAP